MDVRHRLALVRSWARWIVAATLVAALVAFVISNSVLPRIYEANARLFVGQALTSTNPDPNQFATAQQLAAAYVSIAGDRPVLESAVKRLGSEMSFGDFGHQVDVSAAGNLPFIEVIGRDGDPNRAAAIANAMAAEIVAIAPTLSGAEGNRLEFVDASLRAIQVQVEQARAEIDDLLALPKRTAAQDSRLETLSGRLASLAATYAAYLQFSAGSEANRVTIVESAVAPSAPASPRPLFNVGIAAALAFLLSLGAALLWERLDDRLKTVEDVERVTGLATVGLITHMPGDRGRDLFYRLATLLYPRSPAAEAFRVLRTNLEFAGLDKGLRTIVVTSSIPSEGKTVVAANLAIAFAQSGRKTILVDADLRRPGVHEIFGLPNDLGLTDLVRTDEIQVDMVARTTDSPNLTVITAGTIPANPAELLGSRRMASILERLAAATDVLIVDTPPATAVADAAVVAARADATIVVIQSHRASERVVQEGLEALAKVSARVVGAVLNNVPGQIAMPYYGGSRDGSSSDQGGSTFVDPEAPGQSPAFYGRPSDERPVPPGSASRRLADPHDGANP